MSLTSPIPDPDTGLAHTAFGIDCFYCYKPLADPAIHWMGSTTSIYLHAACVFPLFVRLARDLHELDCPEYYRLLRQRRSST